MEITRFLFVVHCHQPAGNFGWVLEEAYESAYRPFVEMLKRHPRIRLAIHYSGALLDWFQEEHPEFLKQLRSLVHRGQVEMLGGGYYEPILAMIPEQDAVGQLEMMREALARLGLAGPQGVTSAWLAERVWEPQLPTLFHRAGIRSTFVDDHPLKEAGVLEGDCLGYYLTEDRGAPLALFPSSKLLRYLVPFKPVPEVLEALRGFRSERPQAVVLADDGEKFGLWPGTNKWVYQEGWLESFFRELESQEDWLKMVTPRECLESLPALGRVYLPSGSYEEMIQWSDGFFRNFLRKYPEADTMHKRMLWVSERLQRIASSIVHRPSSMAQRRRWTKDDRRKTKVLAKARRHLYMAQSNDAYWHGVFGGLYLRHLRRGIYQNLLEAEEALDEARGRAVASKKGLGWVEAQSLDLDADRLPEILLRSPWLTLLIDPDAGGQLLEFSDKVTGLNLLDTLTRRPEPYHQRLRVKKETPVPIAEAAGFSAAAPSSRVPVSIHDQASSAGSDLADLLVYDPYRRAGLIDHLFSLEAQVHPFSRGMGQELGDFVQGPYQGQVKRLGRSAQAVLSRQGRIRLNGESYPLKLTKTITLPAQGRWVKVAQRIVNGSSKKRLSFLFGSELNLGLKDAHVNRIGEAQGVRRFQLVDPAARLEVSWIFHRDTRLWYFPLETVSDSERGMERTYQGVSLTFLWPVELPPGGSWRAAWEVKMESVDDSLQR